MKRTIFAGMFLLSLIAVLVSAAVTGSVLYGRYTGQVRLETKQKTEAFAFALAASKEAPDLFLLAIRSGEHIRLQAADGKVRFDNNADYGDARSRSLAAAAASKTGFGEAVAPAAGAPGRRTVTCAVRLGDGSMLFVSETMDGALLTLVVLIPSALLIVAFLLLLSSIVAGRKQQTLIRAIAALDLENPLSNDTYEELSPLLGRIAKQNAALGGQLEQMCKWQEEFSAITENMREGLVVLDAKASVLSMNRSAMGMLGVPEGSYEGRHILTVNRNLALQGMVRSAMEGVSCERLFSREGRHYQVMASPVRPQGQAMGILLLILDVTEKQNAEQMRREFSANVSHELKTPLTSISGYAEMMKEGLVKPEDMAEFARRMHAEASRLILLIDDIMKLSRLDEENPKLARAPVALLSLSRLVAERLNGAAEQKGVALTVSGEEGVVCGSGQILEEVIANLCDNAIKYNREGGSVALSVTRRGDAVVLTVADTGIGIPKEDQARVFERFYRVDKSHSKQTGGTGLGLSIVKHGALFHGAKIELESTEGQGTAIRLIFPAKGENPKTGGSNP